MKHFIGLAFLFLLFGCSSSDEKARTLYNQALAAQREGKVDEARNLLERVVKKYPETEIATQANGILSLVGGSKVSAGVTEAQRKAAIGSMRTINTASITFLAINGGTYPASIGDLVQAGLLDSRFLGELSGYHFEMTRKGNDNYDAIGRPTNPTETYFYSSSDGVVRFEIGKPAGPGSPEAE